MNQHLSREIGRGQNLLYVAPRRREIHGSPRGSVAMLYSKGAPGIFLLLAKPNFTTRPSVIMRHRDPDSEARVSETFLQSPSNIFRLMPVSLMQMIIRNLHIIDALHFGLTCTDAWCAVWPTLKKFSLSSLGTWAGTPIFCGAEGTMELESYGPSEPPTGDNYMRDINRLLQGRASDRIRPRRRSAFLPVPIRQQMMPDRSNGTNPNQPNGLPNGLPNDLSIEFEVSNGRLLIGVLDSVSRGQRNGLSNGQPNGTRPEEPSQPIMGRVNTNTPRRTNRRSSRREQRNATSRPRSSERIRRSINRDYQDLPNIIDLSHPYGDHPSQPNGVTGNHPNGIRSNQRAGAPDLRMPANAYIRTGAYYPVDLLTIINPCPVSLYRTEPGDEWILRSLTARQYVRSTSIALHPGYIKGPFIMGIGFGEVIFAMTVWTSTSRGRWAGHSLDIILLSQLEEEEDSGDWEDVGGYVRQFMHESFRMHYGVNWQEEAVKLAW